MENRLLNRIEEVIRVDAIITSPEDFLATHMPFKNLKYYNSGQPVDFTKQYKENEFFKEFMIDNNEKHSFIIVEGDSGSGKSHFIRWVKYKYENEIDINKELCILIKRAHNTLQGAIKQIIELDEIKNLLDENEIEKLNQANSNLSNEKLIYTITNSFITEIQSEDDEECLLKKSQRKILVAFMQDPIIQENILFKENGPIERIKDKISSQDINSLKEIDITFNEEDFKFGFDSEIMRRMKNFEETSSRNAIKCAENLIENRRNFKNLIIQYLNSKIDSVIQGCIQLTSQDFLEIFIKLRKELKKQDKNLTLFIEDLTSFTGIDKALVETLIIDHNGDESLCRLFSVVGLTTAYYNNHFPDNLKARVTGRIIIDDKSIISSENDILSLSSRYLNAIYLDNKILKSWIKSGAIEEDLPISDKYNSHRWSIYLDENNREFSLFPFNKNALINLYQTLEEKTPRKFLAEIIKKLFTEYIKSPKNFPCSEKEFQSFAKIPSWKEPLHQQIVMKQASGYDAERLSCFLKVWGDRTAYKTIIKNKEYLGSVPKEAYDLFNIPFISGVLKDNSESNTPLNNKTISNVLKDKPKAITKENVTKTKVVDIEIDKKRQIFDKKMDEINYWYKENGIFTDHLKYRDDIAKILKDMINWEVEDVSPLIVEAFLTKSRIHIRGQKVQIDKGFVLERTDENYYFLQAITAWRYLGGTSWGFEDSLGYLSNITNWIIKNKKEILNLMKLGEKVDDDLILKNWDMLKWGIYNEYILNVINGKISSKYKNNEFKIYSTIFSKNFDIDINKAKRLNKLALTIENKKEDLKQNHEFVLRYYNCILGEAKPETTTSFYLDAYELISIIKELKEIKWDINKLTIPNVKENVTKWQTTYNIINNVWKDKLEKSISENILYLDSVMKNIKDKVQYNSEEEENVNKLFVEFKNFLTKKMQSVNETYGEEFGSVINENINGKTVLTLINNFQKLDKNDCIDKLIYVVSKNLVKAEEINTLLSDMERYINNKYNKFTKITAELKTVDEEFREITDTFNSYIDDIEEALLEMHGGDNSAINR